MNANRISTEYFTIYYQKELKKMEFLGCVSAKKLGNAVLRNKLKRKLKNAAKRQLRFKFKV